MNALGDDHRRTRVEPQVIFHLNRHGTRRSNCGHTHSGEGGEGFGRHERVRRRGVGSVAESGDYSQNDGRQRRRTGRLILQRHAADPQSRASHYCPCTPNLMCSSSVSIGVPSARLSAGRSRCRSDASVRRRAYISPSRRTSQAKRIFALRSCASCTPRSPHPLSTSIRWRRVSALISL